MLPSVDRFMKKKFKNFIFFVIQEYYLLKCCSLFFFQIRVPVGSVLGGGGGGGRDLGGERAARRELAHEGHLGLPAQGEHTNTTSRVSKERAYACVLGWIDFF